MSDEEMFAVVWREPGEPGRAWTITDSDGQIIRRPLEGVKGGVYAVVTDRDELEEVLSRDDGRRYAAPVELVAEVLGWDL